MQELARRTFSWERHTVVLSRADNSKCQALEISLSLAGVRALARASAREGILADLANVLLGGASLAQLAHRLMRSGTAIGAATRDLLADLFLTG